MSKQLETKKLIINDVLYAYYQIDKDLLLLNLQKEIIDKASKKASEHYFYRLIEYIEKRKFNNMVFLSIDDVELNKKELKLNLDV